MRVWTLTVSLLVVACDGADRSARLGLDVGAAADARAVDAGDALDGGARGPDASLPDAASPDAATPDTAAPDAVAADSVVEPPTAVVYDPSSEAWLATPWPSDRHREADGTLRLDMLPFPVGVPPIPTYLAYAAEVLDGFGLNGAIYFAFDGPLDPATLPDPRGSTDPDATLQLVHLTAGDRYGERVPLIVQATRRPDAFLPPHSLAFRAVRGFPLAERATYCAFLTHGVTGAAGRPVEASPAFTRALAGDEETLAPLRVWLAEQGADPGDVALATCFTTQDATWELRAVHALVASLPTPVVEPIEHIRRQDFGDAPHVLAAWYIAPNFQAGAPPYRDDGDFRFDADGAPIVQQQERLRFALMLPPGEAPPNGWPVYIYSHGTGGSRAGCLREDRGGLMEAMGAAVLCIDQPLHGVRGEGTGGWLDIANPRSSRSVLRQSAVDMFSLTKMVVAGVFVLSPELAEGADVHLDPERVHFFGHSQGALTGPLALGFVREWRSLVASAGGGLAIEGALRRADQQETVALLSLLLGVDAEALDGFHPVLTFLQMLADASDPINYAPTWDAAGPKHLLFTEGLMDPSVPGFTTEALAATAGVPIIAPVHHESLAHALLGIASVQTPVSGNLLREAGAVTAGVAQSPHGTHSAAFTDGDPTRAWLRFAATALHDEVPTIAPP